MHKYLVSKENSNNDEQKNQDNGYLWECLTVQEGKGRHKNTAERSIRSKRQIFSFFSKTLWGVAYVVTPRTTIYVYNSSKYKGNK